VAIDHFDDNEDATLVPRQGRLHAPGARLDTSRMRQVPDHMTTLCGLDFSFLCNCS
jgi:hypothetical protein